MIQKNSNVPTEVNMQMDPSFEYCLFENRHCVRSLTDVRPMRRNARGQAQGVRLLSVGAWVRFRTIKILGLLSRPVSRAVIFWFFIRSIFTAH